MQEVREGKTNYERSEQSSDLNAPEANPACETDTDTKKVTAGESDIPLDN